MQAPIAVGFDFDHTLGIDNKLERTVALEFLADLAERNSTSYDATAAEHAMDDLLARSRAGEMPIETAVAGLFEGFAPAGSAIVDLAQDFRDAVVARASDYVRALPGANELLAALDERGIPYALLTNGWSPLQEEKARILGFRGSVYVSERIGSRKPAREAFDVLTKHFELPAESIWYVGDDPQTDIAGAAAAGFTTVWFDWEGRSYPPDAVAPQHTIRSLHELIALLQGRGDALANLKE